MTEAHSSSKTGVDLYDQYGDLCRDTNGDPVFVKLRDFEQQVKRGDILNAELSGFMKAATKREADQSAEIERLQDSINRCSTEEGLCYAVELKRKDAKIERLRAALVRTKDAAWDCRGALRRFEMSVREQVRNGGMTQATRTELARAADRADESEKSAMKALDAVRVTDETTVPRAEPFVVKHYTSESRPIIKGNGFDGLEIGEDREEAQEFVDWLNARLAVNGDGCR